MTRRARATLRSVEQLRVLASPATFEVFEALQSDGPATVAELGPRLGRKPNSLHYHVRKLLRLELIEVVETRRSGARTESVYDTTATQFDAHDHPADPARRAAGRQAAAALLRLAAREYALATEDPPRALRRDDLAVERHKAWFDAAALARVHEHLDALRALFAEHARPVRGKLCALSFALTPVHRDAGERGRSERSAARRPLRRARDAGRALLLAVGLAASASAQHAPSAPEPPVTTATAPVASTATTAPDKTATSPGIVARFPYEDFGGLVMVPVTIEGSRPLRCLLDTGMPEGVFLVDPAVGRELGLEYAARVPVSGTGPGSETADLGMGLGFELAGQRFDAQRAIVLSEPSALLTNAGFDGAIGASVFQRFVVELDPGARTVTLLDPAIEPAPPADDAVVLPLSFRGTDVMVDAEVSVAGEERARVRLLVDTGANVGLTLHADRDGGVPLPEPRFAAPVTGGVGGQLQGVVGRVSALHLGGHVLRDFVASFPRGSSAAEDGTLGMGLLDRFHVRIDVPERRLTLTPTERLARLPRENMAGLGLRPRGDGRLLVAFVLDDGPAARAGLRTGDVLLAVDGVPLEQLGWSAARARFEQPGEARRLRVAREGAELELSLELRRLL